jgi:mono/diheme cytochrome c family protein
MPESGPRNKPRPTAVDGSEQARQMFATVCMTCHGAEGHGDGPAAASLGSAKPRDYTDAAWQASVTDDEIRKAILLGGAAIGKSPMMPGNPQLKDKPEVVEALVQIVRGFGKQ